MSLRTIIAGMRHSLKVPKRSYPDKKVLILEGGGMRGVFTTGVLQAFSERAYFPWKLIVGSSAGAITAVVYAARQIHLVRDAFFTDLTSGNFIQLSNFFRPSRHIIDLDCLIAMIFHRDEPLDIRVLRKACRILITATKFKDGEQPETIYLDTRHDDLSVALKATAALPIFHNGFVTYNNHQLVDGGVLDPIPYKKALSLGYREKDIVVVATRKKGYRKRPMSIGIRTFYEQYYREEKYRFLLEAIKDQHLYYNDMLDELEQDHTDIEIIYPPDDFIVDRLTQDSRRILVGFEQGIAAGRRYLVSNCGYVELVNVPCQQEPV